MRDLFEFETMRALQELEKTRVDFGVCGVVASERGLKPRPFSRSMTMRRYW